MALEYAVRASAIDMLDKPLMVVLRDGRKLVGTLRTFDQYSNIVLEDTSERRIFNDMFTDVRLGLYLIRGENIVIMGVLDPSRKQEAEKYLHSVTEEELEKARARPDESKENEDGAKLKKGLLDAFDDEL